MKRDAEATAAMCFEEANSYVHLSGRHIYVGADAAKARAAAMVKWEAEGRKCHRCGKYVRPGDEDWEHLIPKGPHGCDRDDHPRNRAFGHGMFSVEPCHRNEHNREIKWSPRSPAEAMVDACVRCVKCGAKGVGTCDCWPPRTEEAGAV